MQATLFNESPLVRDTIRQAERELQETIRALNRRTRRVSKVTTTDDEELKLFLKAFPSLRKFPQLRGDDRLSRCRGCRVWLLAEGTRRGRTGVPECAAVKVGIDSLCGGCLARAGASA